HVRTLPGLMDLAEGKVTVADIHEVDIADLLGRDSVAPVSNLLHANITNKVVMVTGAGGSIGSELCRQILKLQPTTLILYELNEFGLYEIEKELEQKNEALPIIAVLGSVLNQQRLEAICQKFSVQTIYHAAAYKHVPMVEKNTSEGIRNNIFGTLSCAKAAISSKVETFVLISTDKAVRPTNTMGASKRMAELVLQAFAEEQQQTRFTMVRFGNVLGSSGSVIPLFREQIARGGPVTVTDPRIIRYFMTIPEAAELVIQAGAMGQGGDVFVLDMGEPVRILDLAKRNIHLSGFIEKDTEHPDGDIEIIYTGLRPGEKLYEELLIGDNVSKTQHQKIMRAQEQVIPWAELSLVLQELEQFNDADNCQQVRDILMTHVAGFKPQCGVEDWLA
ncbi:MAG: FlaA1/EpsC-like NDP-sugar epimerase, partial [Oceanospirillaceae bacterium]